MKRKIALIVLFPFTLVSTILATIFMCSPELYSSPIKEISIIASFFLWVGLLYLAFTENANDYDIGFERGYDAACKSEYDRGYKDACELGNEGSYNNGFDAGTRDGYAKAKEESILLAEAKYNEGYDAGYHQGYSEGNDCGYDAGFYKGSHSAVEALQNNISSTNGN